MILFFGLYIRLFPISGRSVFDPIAGDFGTRFRIFLVRSITSYCRGSPSERTH